MLQQVIIRSSHGFDVKKIAIASAALAFTSCQKDIGIYEWTVSSRDSYFQKVECNVVEDKARSETTLA